jgi:predicted RNase H-like HicB family nuclease
MAMEPADILRKAYARQVMPQPDGLFKAEILEFPGCFAIGDTAADALGTLEEVAVDWIAAAIAQGQYIPEPMESSAYSGKFVVRMSKALHKKATQFAMRDGVSLNQFVVNCVAEHVGMLAAPLRVYVQPAQLLSNFSFHLSIAGSASSFATPAGGGVSIQHAATPADQVVHLPLERPWGVHA